MSFKPSAALKILPLVLILAAAAFLMFTVSQGESATMDELAHIPAGYGYARFLDYRLNPEHPPLLKALATLPLLTLKLNFPTASVHWQTDVNGEWDVGTQFLYQSGNNADQIVQTARLFPIILTLITILIVYLWSRALVGPLWALLPTFLFALSPTVLAHGHYVTTDMAAAFGFLIGLWSFVRFLERPTAGRIVIAGLLLGVAELAKFSTALLIPLFVLLFIFFWIGEWIRKKRFRPKEFFKFIGRILLIFLIALAVIYAVYFVFTWNYPMEKQVSDTTSIMSGFQVKAVANAEIAIAGNVATRPIAQYFLGVLMAFTRSAGGNTDYFLGQVSNAGWWNYFPVLFGLKETIPALVIVFLGLVFGLRRFFAKIFRSGRFKSFADYIGTHLAEFAMILTVIVYWAYSIHSPLNIGIRHLLPTIPLLYVLAAGSLKSFFAESGQRTARVAGSILIVLIVWAGAETAFAYPYFLSYFNEFAGGTINGYRIVDDSNYDWGQDLKRLVTFVEEHDIQKIAVDYFGGGNPKYYLGDKEVDWSSKQGDPRSQGIHYLAVSVNTLEGAVNSLGGSVTRDSADTYSWLVLAKPLQPGLGGVPTPDYRVGTSIFVYYLK